MSKSHNTCRNYPHVTKLLETMVYARRRRMRISQSVLAEKTGLTRNCIQQMECYEHLPRMETLFDLMLALEFTESERKGFLEEFLNAYYADKASQAEREKQLAGVI